MKHIGTEGDLGDSVVLLGVIRQIDDGPHTLFLQQSNVTKMRTQEAMAAFNNAFSPLAKAQSYIADCRVATPEDSGWWNSGGFRGKGLHSKTSTLFNAVLSHLILVHGIGRGFKSSDPWLEAEASPSTRDRVVIARSDRYRNGSMPWAKILEFYGERLIFVGSKAEHERFCNETGSVEYLPTNNLLELAKAIKGSLLFIGNQSSPMAVCEGLKHRSIQETCLTIADCVYKRDNAQYCYDGRMTLPGFDGVEDLIIRFSSHQNRNISTIFTPPKGWTHPKIGPSTNFKQALSILKALPVYRGVSEEIIKQEIIDHNVERVPDFFISKNAFGSARRAMQEAGYDL